MDEDVNDDEDVIVGELLLECYVEMFVFENLILIIIVKG